MKNKSILLIIIMITLAVSTAHAIFSNPSDNPKFNSNLNPELNDWNGFYFIDIQMKNYKG